MRAGPAVCNAAFTGQLHVLQRLRSADVDVNASDPAFGGTALMVAAGKGHRECVELLLACGAQKDAAARDGKTAFIVAALNGFVGHKGASLRTQGCEDDASNGKATASNSKATAAGTAR